MRDKVSTNDGGIGSVKAAVTRYGGQVNQNTGVRNNFRKNASDSSEERDSQAPELHIARKTFDKFNEYRKVAETVASQAELELRHAKIVARDLSSQIEKLKLKGRNRHVVQEEGHQYLTIVKEFEKLRQEVSKMKLDIKRMSKEKSRAENEMIAAGLRLASYVKTAEKLRREIDEANEEEVLVELAQIQARKELAEIDTWKREESENYASRIQEVRKKIKVMRNEVEQAKQSETVLAVTNSEVVELQKELSFIKEMENRRNLLTKNPELCTVEEDLEAVRKEKSSMKAKVFQIMTSVDLIRIELNNILDEKNQIEKEESATEKYIKKLNLKLVRAKDELKAAKSSAEKAEMMVPSLTLSLKELKKVTKEAHEEHKSISEETASVCGNIQEIESTTDLTEGRLRDILEELEERKKAEANAMGKLETVVERVLRIRTLKSTGTITLTKFEYDYLAGCAKGAEEIADKKLAAARAWAEALNANVNEMQIKTTMAKNEITELKLKEERALIELEMQKTRDEEKKSVQVPRLMIESSYSLTPVRQAKFRKSFGSPAARRPIISTFWTVERKRKATAKNGNYFAKVQLENEKKGSLEMNQRR